MAAVFLATAPLALESFLVPLLIGVAFGYTLESTGFGDSRRLAAQFYFTEMRVLKTMFTAIVTCLLLLAWSSALGWLDLDALFVNPTYLASGILGGILLGLGFIIGGYCPGTSLVSAATLKIDGIIFVVGVGVGSFVFGETADGFRLFYDDAGALGRFTLPEWLGLSHGVVVVLVVLMALGMFWGGELLERRFSRRAVVARGPTRLWRPAVKGGGVALLVLLALSLALPALGQPSLADRVGRLEPEMRPILARREVHLDPLEVLGLMHRHVEGALGRFAFVVLDVRPESDFNRFHLADARHVTRDEVAGDDGRALAGAAYARTIFVICANDEAPAEEAWRVLYAQGVRNHYVLAGGVNLWLDVFKDGRTDARAASGAAADGRLRHDFGKALGERYGFAKPLLPVFQRMVESKARPFPWKAKPVVKAPSATGGCG